jgi:flagellar biosynthesis activator protein FlaF
MYKFAYQENVETSSASGRDAERQALEHSLQLLRIAAECASTPVQMHQALNFVTSLWSFLLEDLAKPDNALPAELRASLISIGFWMLRESEAIGDGRSANIKGLIEITQMILDGLQ